jgi:hypothetical protein
MKKPTKPIKKGRKFYEWERVRKKLKTIFQGREIMHCEMCGKSWGLSFAHSKKRRFIAGDEIMQVALLCIPCHQTVEADPEMTAKILGIIENRGWDAMDVIEGK